MRANEHHRRYFATPLRRPVRALRPDLFDTSSTSGRFGPGPSWVSTWRRIEAVRLACKLRWILSFFPICEVFEWVIPLILFFAPPRKKQGKGNRGNGKHTMNTTRKEHGHLDDRQLWRLNGRRRRKRVQVESQLLGFNVKLLAIPQAAVLPPFHQHCSRNATWLDLPGTQHQHHNDGSLASLV